MCRRCAVQSITEQSRAFGQSFDGVQGPVPTRKIQPHLHCTQYIHDASATSRSCTAKDARRHPSRRAACNLPTGCSPSWALWTTAWPYGQQLRTIPSLVFYHARSCSRRGDNATNSVLSSCSFKRKLSQPRGPVAALVEKRKLAELASINDQPPPVKCPSSTMVRLWSYCAVVIFVL